MRLGFQQFISIALLTALETARQPICLLLVTCSVLFTGLLPMVITHTMGEAGKLTVDSALAIHFMFGLGLSTYAACLTLSREIRLGTVSSILSKPVGRNVFLSAKFAGVAGVTLLYSAAQTLALLMSARAGAESFQVDIWAAGPLLLAPPIAFAIAGGVNYFSRRPFSSNAFGWLLGVLCAAFVFTGWFNEHGTLQTFGTGYNPQLIAAGVLIALAVIMLQSLALAFALRLDAVPTLTICSLFFLLGLVSDFLFGRYAADNLFARTLYYLMPNWQRFWMADALTAGGVIPWSFVGQAALYALGFSLGVLCLAMWLFNRGEVKR